MNALLAFFSRDVAGLAIAAAVGALGLALRAAAAPGWLWVAPILVATLLAAASIRHVVVLAVARRRSPPPGRRVDIGGHRMHVLAEGEARGDRPPVVWFAGGHASGYAIHHLHRAFRDETRSILVDRPGTGWSDVGPFPRTTAREADEVVRALERAGERGPFVWVGHSFGGLLVANIARRRPDLAHALVLLDPTPLETIVFGPRLAALRGMRREAWLAGFAQLFGIDLVARGEQRQRRAPAYARVLDAVEAMLGADVLAGRAVERRAGVHFARASIFRELTPAGAAAVGYETVVYDGDLGDLPVFLVAPRDDAEAHEEIRLLPEAQRSSATELQRMARFYAASRERYLATSRRARRIVAPAGAGHNFVFELPDFTIGALRQILLGDGDRAAGAPPATPHTHGVVATTSDAA